MAGPRGTLLLPRNKGLQVPIVLANCHPVLCLVRCVALPSSLMARYSGDDSYRSQRKYQLRTYPL